jgi:pyruvate,water dikinase
MSPSKYIHWFRDLSIGDIANVGGKNASLGEMYRELTPMGINVPDGFAINIHGYWNTINSANKLDELKELMDDINIDDIHDLDIRSQQARKLITSAALPNSLRKEIVEAYRQFVDLYGVESSVAVRSSATAEDLPTASFAGQHDTFLNVRTEDELLTAYQQCLASLFTSRAIAYRINNNFNHFKVALSVGVMKMIRSDIATSGVMFSLDTESGFKDVVFITAAYGLGENIVQGNVSPDEFYVHKPTFEQGYRSVLRKSLGDKAMKMVYSGEGASTKQEETLGIDKRRFCMSDEEVLILADYAIKTEKHYSLKAGEPRPMDMEWAKDGIDNQLYLIQARPETVISQQQDDVLEQYRLKQTGELIVRGRAAGNKIAIGKAKIITHENQLSDFKAGEVLVSESTSPDWGPVFKKAAAIITNRGGRTCHAAIVARELGIPAVIGTEDGTEKIYDGQLLTVSCAEGEVGEVYAGQLEFEVIKTNLSTLPKTHTRLMINLGNPDLAFRLSSLPCDGVGLARMEFIINNHIGIHPMALVHLDKVDNKAEREIIDKLVSNYADPQTFFIEKLSEGVGTIAAAFYPRPVIVRMSDFKTNEYANLIGGKSFEPSEDNPMLGFRGASRYIHPAYEEGFSLECSAMRRVRDEMGFNNVILMIPFCRRVQEGKEVIEKMNTFGLQQGVNDLKIYMMCEIPNNVLLVDEFLKIFDGISIGSNDLTQLILGVDRDSEIVSFDFDERDAGVLKMIRLAIEGAKRNKSYVGICGQAPSDYPEITEWLVSLGIDSISLNPDSLLETLLYVNDIEAKKIK